jgi:hypothetical protein
MVLLILIAIIVATRRVLTLTGIIKPYINPKFGAFDSAFSLSLSLTLLHIFAGTFFLILTPLQFSKKIRAKNIGFHRFCGWLVAASALIIGITALVMSYKMAIGGMVETVATFTFALFFLFALYKALYHIRYKKILLHREWMIRMFSVGLAIATVRPIVGMFFAFSSLSPHQFFGLAFWIGFSLHLMLAEIYIRRYKYQPL